MTPKRLIVLCVVFLGIGIGLWQLAERQGNPKPMVQLPKASAESLFKGDPAQLLSLTFEQPRYGRTLVLEVQEGHWLLTEPLRDEPEPFVLEGALQALYGRDWSPAPPEWSTQSEQDLGLEPAAMFVEAQYRDKSREQLVIGAEEETGNWRVARLNESLLRFPIPAFRHIARPVDQWRDHRLQPLGAGLTELLWTPTTGAPLRLQKTQNHWYLRQPVDAPLSEQALPFLLTLLGGRLDGVGNEPLEHLDTGNALGTLVLSKGRESVTLQVFQYGVISDVRDYLLSKDEHTFHFLEMPLEDLISRRLLDLNPEHIVSLRIEYGDKQADYHRVAGGWGQNSGETVDPEQSAFVGALLDYGQGIQRGEKRPLPPRPPSGRILFSISRLPQEKGAKILRWWFTEDGLNLVASEPGTEAYISSVNFELGIRSLFAQSP